MNTEKIRYRRLAVRDRGIKRRDKENRKRKKDRSGEDTDERIGNGDMKRIMEEMEEETT